MANHSNDERAIAGHTGTMPGDKKKWPQDAVKPAETPELLRKEKLLRTKKGAESVAITKGTK